MEIHHLSTLYSHWVASKRVVYSKLLVSVERLTLFQNFKFATDRGPVFVWTEDRAIVIIISDSYVANVMSDFVGGISLKTNQCIWLIKCATAFWEVHVLVGVLIARHPIHQLQRHLISLWSTLECLRRGVDSFQSGSGHGLINDLSRSRSFMGDLVVCGGLRRHAWPLSLSFFEDGSYVWCCLRFTWVPRLVRHWWRLEVWCHGQWRHTSPSQMLLFHAVCTNISYNSLSQFQILTFSTSQ